MRLLFAAILTCALVAPAAALPLGQAGLSAAVSLVQVKSKAKPAKAAKGKGGGKCAAGAICPLVGGGDY